MKKSLKQLQEEFIKYIQSLPIGFQKHHAKIFNYIDRLESDSIVKNLPMDFSLFPLSNDLKNRGWKRINGRKK